uniref:Mechanosensitive ion channel family protein n=1 Tax=candidate division WOR-3 bacterium TaxID=2052148 RepID=A0A7C3ND69_UNCW3
MMDKVIFDNKLSSYLLLLLFILISTSITLFLLIFFREKKLSVFKRFSLFFILLIYSISFHISLIFFTKYTQVYNILLDLTKILYVFTFTFLFVSFMNFFIGRIYRDELLKQHIHLSLQIESLLKKTVLVFSLLIALTVILSILGVNVLSLITGLGIGSAAIALAAQDLLTNLIGGMTIFFSKVLNVGDLVEINDEIGYIISIGLRTTKLKRYDNKIVVFPNSIVAKSKIINHMENDIVKISYVLQLEYKTPVENIKKAADIVTKILNDDERIKEKNSINVGFYKFDQYSLNIYVNFAVNKNMDVGAIKEDFHYLVKYNFDKEGIKFAFPTQTVELENKE